MARQRIYSWREGTGRIESVHRFKTRPPLFSSRILPTTIVQGREDCTVSICPTTPAVPRRSSLLDPSFFPEFRFLFKFSSGNSVLSRVFTG